MKKLSDALYGFTDNMHERALALEAEVEGLRWLEEEGHDLRSEDVPTGGDDYTVQWKVVAHFMREPQERVIAYGCSIAEAIHLARTEPLEVGPA